MSVSATKFPKRMDVETTGDPLRIAIVYSRIPLPMRRADQMTVAHLLSFLKARGHAVDLYCVNAGGQADEEDHNWLRQACRNVYLYRHDLMSIIRGLIKVPLQLVPAQVGLFSHPAQGRDMRKAIAADMYDVVYTYYFRSAEMTRGLGRPMGAAARSDKRPVTVLALQLSQTLNTRRIAKNAPNLLTKLFYEVESRLVARYEARIWRHFTHSVLIGPRDVEEIAKTCQAQNQPTINNYFFGAHGTDLDRFGPRADVPEKVNHLVFSGVMRTPTNIHAVQWFAKNVWPKVRAEISDATWAIVGREPSTEVFELGKLPGVTVSGTVADPSEWMAAASICINPMQAGGGMQNKLVEYLASAKAVVATSVANEGVGGRDGEHLLLADDPEDFAQAIISLLKDGERRRSLGQAARTFVLQNWTWEAHFMELEDNFRKAIVLTSTAAK